MRQKRFFIAKQILATVNFATAAFTAAVSSLLQTVDRVLYSFPSTFTGAGKKGLLAKLQSALSSAVRRREQLEGNPARCPPCSARKTPDLLAA